ncbi:MAG: hypothetical protein ACRCU2_00735 [Planktothrix sp.]
MEPIKPKQNKTAAFRNSAEANNRSNRPPEWFSDMIEWLKNQSNPSEYEILLQILAPLWEQAIEPKLIQEFGQGSTLYCIFYQDRDPSLVILEIWDPRYVEQKPSQVFKLEGFPPKAIQNLPKYREQAEILILQN